MSPRRLPELTYMTICNNSFLQVSAYDPDSYVQTEAGAAPLHITYCNARPETTYGRAGATQLEFQ